MNRDYSNADIQKMYDDFYSNDDLRAMKNMKRARHAHPERNAIGHKRLALAYLETQDPAFFLELRTGRNHRRPEPRRTSPVEQMKGRTGLLHQGES